uniref:NTR domain-containing protein n=1 Tax=Eptatretus burgeri TaxID=7764 RepID=A0A8C4QZS1_EPTBU
PSPLWIVLTLWIGPADACSCFAVHPQQHFCNSDIGETVYLKFKRNGPHGYKYFRIKTKQKVRGHSCCCCFYFQVFKGDIPNKATKYFYSPSGDAVCEIVLNLKTKYIITGKQEKHKLMISLCDFVKRWKDVSKMQRHAFRKIYRKTCTCKISHCSSLPCKPHHNGECAWTDLIKSGSLYGPEAKEKFCQRQRNGICNWVDVQMKPRYPVDDLDEQQPTENITVSTQGNASAIGTGAKGMIF